MQFIDCKLIVIYTDGDCSITCEGANVCVDVQFQCPQSMYILYNIIYI